jgi:hypothetical protein
MKITANLIEIERLIRKCADIQHRDSYAACEGCVLDSFCESGEEMHKLIDYAHAEVATDDRPDKLGC